MSETEAIPFDAPKKSSWSWVFPILLQPRRTLAEVVEQSRKTWFVPLLILTLLALANVLVAGAIQQSLPPAAQATLPQDYQYWTPEQQAQYQQNLANNSGPLFIYGFPALGTVVEIWLSWVLLAAILHLTITLLGGRSGFGPIANVVAWAGLPLAVRCAVQIVAMLVSQHLITMPGLSGFAPVDGGRFNHFIAALLPMVDLYLFWQIGLILVGVGLLSGLPKGKVWAGVLIAVLVVLALRAVPGFLGATLGGLTGSGVIF